MAKKKPEQEQAQAEGAQEQAQAKAPGQKLAVLTKLTVATICGKIAVKLLPEEGELHLCRIAGYADGTKTGTTQYGPWSALTGEFAATSMLTGEMFIGKTCIVPGAMGEALVTATEEKLKEDATQKIAFNVDILVKRSPRNPDEKYEYVIRPVMETALSSPAIALLTQQ